MSRILTSTQKFKKGEKTILNDKIDGFGKIIVRIGRSEFVNHPEYWSYGGKPQFFYEYEIIDPNHSNIELSYAHVPESTLSKLPSTKKPRCDHCNLILKLDKENNQLHCPNCNYRVPKEW